MSYPRYQLARALKVGRDDVGDFTVNTVGWANLDTALDITLAAQVGDLVEVGASLYWEAGPGGVYGCLDVHSIVSATPINAWGNGAPVDANHYGIASWIGAPGVISPRGGGAFKALVIGDIASGAVTLRLRARVDTAGTKVIQARATVPFQWWAKNLGPADPN